MQDNTTRDATLDLESTCMLVSDSNEVASQLDSKRLDYNTLVELAESNLFSKFLDMSKYLTTNQYATYKDVLEDKFGRLKQMNDIGQDAISKLRVVDGQVILVEVDSIPQGMSPEQHIKEHWNITNEYQLVPIQNCMLRGNLGKNESLVEKKPNNTQVKLTMENIPPHMHHSSVTHGTGFTTLTKDKTTYVGTSGENLTYNVFCNDSLDIGLSKNELDGTVDKFLVDYAGREVEMYHDNMPEYHAFYGFVVQKIGLKTNS